MAASNRIVYDAATVGGIHIQNAVRYATLAQQEIIRAKNIADSVTAGGATQANLEGCPEFKGEAGQGPTLYSAIVTLNTDLATIPSSLLGNLDQG
jgi:hypothetical protein